MAASLLCSVTKGNKPMNETKRAANRAPLTKAQALDILAAAVNECLSAGWKVTAQNEAGALRLDVQGAGVDLDVTPTRFILAEP